MAIFMCDVHPARTSAARHYAYIMREASYKKLGGIMMDEKNETMAFSGNMPSWSKEDPKKFWKIDDTNEKGNKYREAIIALPNELSPSEQKRLVENIRQKICPNSAYSYAIHASYGSLSSKLNTHVHLMFCEREIEPDRKEPDEKNYFKKSRTLKDGSISGGYRKSINFGKGRKKWLLFVRQSVEDCINEALERNGSRERVSAKSIKEQRKEFEKTHPEATHEELNARFHTPTPKLGRNRIYLYQNEGTKSDRYREYEEVKEINAQSDRAYELQKEKEEEEEVIRRQAKELEEEQMRLQLLVAEAKRQYDQEQKAKLKKKKEEEYRRRAKPNETTVAAIEEGVKIAANPQIRGVHSVGELKKALGLDIKDKNVPKIIRTSRAAIHRPGHERAVFLEFDDGSQRAFIEKDFRKLLKEYPDVAQKYGITENIVNEIEERNKGRGR